MEKKIPNLISEIHEAMNNFWEALKKDPTKELLELLREIQKDKQKMTRCFSS